MTKFNTTAADLAYTFDGSYASEAERAAMTPVVVGTSPAGVIWTIYPRQCRNAAEQRHLVAISRKRLAKAHARSAARQAPKAPKATKATKRRRPTFTVKTDTVRFRNLTTAMVAHLEAAAEDHDSPEARTVAGRTWIEVPTELLDYVLGSLELTAEDAQEMVWVGMSGSSLHSNCVDALAENAAAIQRKCLERCQRLVAAAMACAAA